MSSMIYVPQTPPSIDPREVLRYAGADFADEVMREIANSAIAVCQKNASYRLVYRHLPITDFGENSVTLGEGFRLEGALVSKYLADCKGAYILVATVGSGIDRMITAASVRGMSEGLFADAAGSAAVEALLDAFCARIDINSMPKPRISPGYGDFSLENQLCIFKLLNAEKLLGTCLNDSLLISPSKSVSALVGTGKETSCLI